MNKADIVSILTRCCDELDVELDEIIDEYYEYSAMYGMSLEEYCLMMEDDELS